MLFHLQRWPGSKMANNCRSEVKQKKNSNTMIPGEVNNLICPVVQASARVRVLSGGRYLQINMAELSDRAQYTCVASNIAGQTMRKFNLTVNGTLMYL